MEEYRRTSRDIEESFENVVGAVTARDRELLSQKLGVVIRGDSANPFRENICVNTVFQISPDTFHQDSLVSPTSSLLSAT